METKINIAEILKDKPVGLKFYSNTFGYISFNGVHKDKVYFFSEDTNAHSVKPNGKMYDGGECIIFPSKEMRDWRKFSWEKGDVLVHKDGDVHIIFERFVNDTYCSFVGKYYLCKENNNTEQFYEKERLLTSDFQKASKESAQTYINTIEKRLGGKLNMGTLEIEKAEFKDGDIVYADYGHKQAVFIVSGKINLSEGYNSLVALDLRGLALDMGYMSFFKEDLYKLRFATEEEKRQLFDALAKEGKAWDAEKKQIVDLKQKVELKPFDKVLVRDFSKDKWSISFFSFKKRDCYVCINHCSWNHCIPYKGNEHLLGTTKDVEE